MPATDLRREGNDYIPDPSTLPVPFALRLLLYELEPRPCTGPHMLDLHRASRTPEHTSPALREQIRSARRQLRGGTPDRQQARKSKDVLMAT